MMMMMMMAKKGISQLKPPSSIVVSYFSSSSSSSSLLEEKWRRVRVSVVWDLHSLPVPEGVDPSTVSQKIEAAVRANGMEGPVEITAVADALKISSSTWRALCSTGITITHEPKGKRDISKYFFRKVDSWAELNNPPAHLFVITDGHYAHWFHQLRWRNFNILLASNEAPALGVRRAASVVWRWNDIVKGDNLIGKYFNQPPDPDWYGHYNNVPFEDPLLHQA